MQRQSHISAEIQGWPFSYYVRETKTPPGRPVRHQLTRRCSRPHVTVLLDTFFITNSNSIILTKNTDKAKNIWLLTPIFGTLLFAVLYFVATLYYPGGSQVDKNSIGFSWTNNYWCNLLNETAINGQSNPAKPIAMTGMFVLSLTLSLFWFLFPKYINIDKKLKLTIQISGTIAMTIAFFLFTNIDHDLVTNLASLFGLIATVGTFVGLYKTKWFGLFAFGLVNFLLFGLNSYVYYNKELIVYLPIIQKISFATFLIWVCCIDIKLFSRKEAHHSQYLFNSNTMG